MTKITRYLLALVFALSCRPLIMKASPVYGTDSRRDLYEVSDPKIMKLSRSVAALFHYRDLEMEEHSVLLKQPPFNPRENLAPSERFYDQPQQAFCTGFLIAADLLLTAGHCLSKDKYSTEEMNCRATRVVFDYAIFEKGQKPAAIPTNNVYSCAKVLELRDPPGGRGIFHLKSALTRDWALVKLDRTVPDRDPLTLSDQDVHKKERIFTIGCPLGLPLKVADDAQVGTSIREVFTSNLDSFSGNSGSPVFDSITNQVVGILAESSDEDVVTTHDGLKAKTYPQTKDGAFSTRTAVIRDRVKLEQH